MRWMLILLIAISSQLAFCAVFTYDMGTEKSGLMEGAQLVKAGDAYTAEKGFGWDTPDGLKAYARAYNEKIENKSAGRSDPPPIYTNALTEDCILGKAPAVFRAAVPAGEYEVYVLCGNSYNLRDQYFDFEVAVGEKSERIRYEGGYRFFSRRFAAKTAGEPIDVRFSTQSAWTVNAVMVWDADDDEGVEAMIGGLETQMHGLPAEEMEKWKQDPMPETYDLPQEDISRQDVFRGYLLFHKPFVECVYPNTNPYPHEMNPELRIFASPGEYEPLTFSVRALKPLENVRVAVSDIGPIKAEDIDVRHVRYMKARRNYRVYNNYRIVPDVIERFDSLSLPENHSHRFWLTVRVPDGAKPGLYDGTVTLLANESSTEIPVRLRVLDVELREDPDKTYGIYYRDPIDRWVNANDDVSKAYFLRKSELEHADMVAHGTRNAILSAWCREENADGEFVADWTGLSKKIEMARKYNFKPPFVVSINTGGVYRKHMDGESLGSHIRLVKDPPQEFYDEMTRMAAFVESERVKNGWPEFLYYPIDEPGRSEVAVRFMTNLMKALRKAGVKTYVTADPVHEAFEPMMPRTSPPIRCMRPSSR